MKFDQITIISALTIIASYLIKLIGLPQQAYRIYKSGDTKNVSTVLFIFSFISYTLWTYYGVLKNDYVIIIGQSVGILTSGIVLFVIYKSKKKIKL
jgi:MtN3 and saliva related transmembrane protein